MGDKTIYSFSMQSLEGKDVSLSDYKGKVVLIVNVASECGYTPQYTDLQALFDEFKDQGLVILGFPANNFGAQEPGSDADIRAFCTSNYGVTFPMFSKISVKGEDQHPFYFFLTHASENGSVDAEMKWNFQKFLVGRDGMVIQSISPKMRVTEPEIREKILELLKAE